MFEAKEKFLDRIEQSFVLLKNNFALLATPYIIFSIVFIAILPALGLYLFNLSFPLENLSSEGNPLTDINLGIAVTYALSLSLIYVLLYVSALMLIQIGTIVGVKNALRSETIDPRQNITGYALKNLSNIFKTYWYIFAYVALIPAIIFIVGGCLFIAYMAIGGAEILKNIGIFLMAISVIIFIFFSIYRGMRATFALSYAVEKESFTKENFNDALQMVDGKWWRVFWNFFLVGIIGSLITSLLTNLTNALGLIGSDYTSTLSSLEGKDTQQIMKAFEAMGDFSILSLFSTILHTTAGAILGVFMMVFLYVFMMRLEKEKFGIVSPVIIKEEIQEEKKLDL